MTPITVDIETYWTREYSLSKISFVEYIKDPAFEIISCAIKLGNKPTYTVFGHDNVGAELRKFDWSQHAMWAHNGNEFDFPALVWTYDIHPKMFLDTVCLARPKHQSSTGCSLSALTKHYVDKLDGIVLKDDSVLTKTQGRRLIDFTADELRQMAIYNTNDTTNAYLLGKHFLSDCTPDTDDIKAVVKAANQLKLELWLMDATARMICYPQFRCDTDLLERTLEQVQRDKEATLEALCEHFGVLTTEEVRQQLASQPKFADALRAVGVKPPLKISKTTGKETYALAKTDEDMQKLLEHPDERVQALASARLEVKSTLLETRLQKIATCAKLMGGWLPVPLAYHSATTGRWGGRVWNPQNLPRIPRDKEGGIVHKPANALRLALRAPKGKKVVVSDLSGIELRVNHYLWGVESTQRLYEKDPKADLYKAFAAKMYNKPESEVTKDERQLAKVAQLGLGFGAGPRTFQRVAKLMGGIDLSENEAEKVVYAWRDMYSQIYFGWQACNRAIQAMMQKSRYSIGSLELVQTDDSGGLMLPSSRVLHYPDLRVEFPLSQDENRKRQGALTEIRYGRGKYTSRLSGPMLCENIVQAIARDVISWHAVEIYRATGQRPALTVHDELVYVVGENTAEDHLATVNSIMRVAPPWLPGIVLWSEGDVADSYGEAK